MPKKKLTFSSIAPVCISCSARFFKAAHTCDIQLSNAASWCWWSRGNDPPDIRFIAAEMRSLVATSFAYKIISASITDMWAFCIGNYMIINVIYILIFVKLIWACVWIIIIRIFIWYIYIYTHTHTHIIVYMWQYITDVNALIAIKNILTMRKGFVCIKTVSVMGISGDSATGTPFRDSVCNIDQWFRLW